MEKLKQKLGKAVRPASSALDKSVHHVTGKSNEKLRDKVRIKKLGNYLRKLIKSE